MSGGCKRTRADKGDGSVKQIASGKHQGKWRVRLTYRDHWNRKQDLDKIFPTQRDGKDFLKKFIRDLEGGKVQEDAQTLAEWHEWLKENDWPGSVKEVTIINRVSRFENHIRPLLGELPLTAIRPMTVKSFYQTLEQRKVGQSTIQEIKRDLVGMLNKAIDEYEVLDATRSNPFAKIKVQTPTLRTGVALTPNQAKVALLRMYAHANRGELDPWIVFLSAIALYGGLRRGELLALTEEQFDFKQGLLTVNRAVRVTNGRQDIGLPKKDKIRSVVLAPTLCKWLQCYLEDTQEQRGESGLFFPSSIGKPLQVYRLQDAWNQAKTLAKLPADMILHDCRLTHNNWIEKLMPNVSDSTRFAHMGHAATGVNLKYYTREITPAMDELRRGLEAMIRGQ